MHKFIEKLLILVVATAFLALASCEEDEEPLYTFPDAGNYGIDGTKLADAYTSANYVKAMGALIVEVDGEIVAEEYYSGFPSNHKFNIKGITSSIMGLLTYKMLEDQLIDSINQPIGTILGDLIQTSDATKRGITIEQILTMTAGFDWDEWDDINVYNRWVVADDQINYLFSKNIVYTPGQRFNYNTALPHILSAVITEKSGQNTLDYAKEKLFTPLSITDVEWNQFDESYYHGSADIFLNARDLLKIGRLCLDSGLYEGNQVISSEWVNKAITKKITTNDLTLYGTGYGYYWFTGVAHDTPVIWTFGYGGQLLVLLPEKNAVLLSTTNYSDPFIDPNSLLLTMRALVFNDIIPAFE